MIRMTDEGFALLKAAHDKDKMGQCNSGWLIAERARVWELEIDAAGMKEAGFAMFQRAEAAEARITHYDDSCEAMAIRLLGQEKYDNSPCQASSMELIENEFKEWKQRAEIAEITLKDSTLLHYAMLRGTVPKLSWRQVCHLSGEVYNGEEAQLSEIVRLREKVQATETRIKELEAERICPVKEFGGPPCEDVAAAKLVRIGALVEKWEDGELSHQGFSTKIHEEINRADNT